MKNLRGKAAKSNQRAMIRPDRVTTIARAVDAGIGTLRFTKAIETFTADELARLGDELAAYYAYKFSLR